MRCVLCGERQPSLRSHRRMPPKGSRWTAIGCSWPLNELPTPVSTSTPMHNATEASIAKLDAARARRIGSMLVTDIGDFHEPRQTLFDLAKADARELLAQFTKARENFATSPFDPKGYKLKFYRKGYTIWSGYPGAGKTTALRQLI